MDGNLFQATDDERAYYRTRVYPLQDRILAVAGTYGDALVLTGGTALACCYLDHRFSDDPDLFHRGGHVRELARDFAEALRATHFDVAVRVDEPGFGRLMVGDETVAVQVDLAADLPRVEEPLMSHLGIFVHTLREIAANKIVTFEDRAEAKDAVDLYYLTRGVEWDQMVADADTKRVPLDYESLQRLLSQPLSGKVLLTQGLDEREFETFLRELRHKLELTIQKKTSPRPTVLGLSSLSSCGTRRNPAVSSTTRRRRSYGDARAHCLIPSAQRFSPGSRRLPRRPSEDR